ncbi:RNA-binding protein S4 [Companilactobacillus sp. RD055328]|uniref:YlmH family RNA-binding protein n=1 Tax=Companilactobacillus sp. RD055328 TaxID=2916634 RepID=UPI001FC8B260|nr:YlmH/Sll1252 family protein [Companilactobacillus sp. RD055328]GKQ42843.1 RNA-binding protein S4 [Companilactobacillus sp. RD055328]
MSSDFFRSEETHFVQRIEEIFQRVEKNNYLELTDFFNMREQYIVENIANRYPDIQVFYEGGYYGSERKRIIIAPDYYQLDNNDFELSIIEIRFNSKFIQLKHSQILGALVHLGIDRDFFGDIITDGKQWQFLVKESMRDFVINNLQKIGNNTVHLSAIEKNKLLLPRDDSDNETITVRSFRLDAIISTVYNVSRQNAKDFITRGKVTINWVKTNKIDHFVSMNDTISVRGYGRVRITEIFGQTQNSKWKMSVNVIRK